MLLEIQEHVQQGWVFPAIAMAVQLGKGIMDQQRAKRESAKADALHAAIPREDAGVVGHLNDIRLRQRYAEDGASRLLSYKKDMIEGAGQQARSNLERGAGTSPGMLQQGLLRSQRQTQGALAQAGAESEALVPQYLNMQTPLIADIADRKLSLDSYLRDKSFFQGAQSQQNANTAFTGLMGLVSQLDPKADGEKKKDGTGTTDVSAGSQAPSFDWGFNASSPPGSVTPQTWQMVPGSTPPPITSPDDWIPPGLVAFNK